MKFERNGEWFGLTPPAGTDLVAAWGCRAILEGNYRCQNINVLFDRAQFLPRQDVDLEFVAWCSSRLHAWLGNLCGQKFISPGIREELVLDDGLFHARANANASYGYLYVVAWMDDVTANKLPTMRDARLKADRQADASQAVRAA